MGGDYRFKGGTAGERAEGIEHAEGDHVGDARVTDGDSGVCDGKGKEIKITARRDRDQAFVGDDDSARLDDFANVADGNLD